MSSSLGFEEIWNNGNRALERAISKSPISNQPPVPVWEGVFLFLVEASSSLLNREVCLPIAIEITPGSDTQSLLGSKCHNSK